MASLSNKNIPNNTQETNLSDMELLNNYIYEPRLDGT